MRTCPSPKKIMFALAGQGRGSSAIRAHLEQCPSCQALAHEESRVDTFFRTNFQPEPPPDFLWTRIEARLTPPARQTRWSALVHNFAWQPVLTVAGGFLLVMTLALILLPSIGSRLTHEPILSSIDVRYQHTIDILQSLDDNPFDGRQILESARDENPFQVHTGSAVPGSTDENPFTAVKRSDYNF